MASTPPVATRPVACRSTSTVAGFSSRHRHPDGDIRRGRRDRRDGDQRQPPDRRCPAYSARTPRARRSPTRRPTSARWRSRSRLAIGSSPLRRSARSSPAPSQTSGTRGPANTCPPPPSSTTSRPRRSPGSASTPAWPGAFSIATITGTGLGELGFDWVNVGPYQNASSADPYIDLHQRDTTDCPAATAADASTSRATVPVTVQTAGSLNNGQPDREPAEQRRAVTFAATPQVTSIQVLDATGKPAAFPAGPTTGGTEVVIHGSRTRGRQPGRLRRHDGARSVRRPRSHSQQREPVADHAAHSAGQSRASMGSFACSIIGLLDSRHPRTTRSRTTRSVIRPSPRCTHQSAPQARR